MNAEMRKALRPLVEPARAHLRDLDADLVPHRLRVVVKSSARRLPPHLERLLLETIADDEELRSAIGGRWADAGGNDPLIESFLANPEDAAEEGEALAEVAEVEELRARVGELERERDDLHQSLAEAKARAASERKAFTASLRDQKAADKRARAGLEARAAAADAAKEVLGGEAESLSRELSRATDRIESLEGEVSRLRDRASRSSVANPVERSPDRPVVPTRPVELAQWLDAEERAMRPYREAASEPSGDGTSEPGVLVPEGVAPDQAEALAAVLEQRPSLVVVDGYNLAGVLGLSPIHSADARSRVIAMASSIKRRSGGDVTVVFDAVGVEGRDEFTAESGVRVAFSKDRLADDEIVRIAEGARGGVVVISDDREVRERAARHGAVTLWSAAVAAESNT